jgi:murein DD-endopeptidase MepM/ murein hydrolase activator NlpD
MIFPTRHTLLAAGALFIFTLGFCTPLLVSAGDVGPATLAQTATSTQNTGDQSAQIAELEAEIAQLQAQLTTTTSQKQTLQSAITGLNLNIQKLQKSITLTQTQIVQNNSQITQLGVVISTTTTQTMQMQQEISNSLQQLNMLDAQPMIIALLSGETLSAFLDQVESLTSLRDALEQKISTLASLKSTLQASRTSAQQKQAQLVSLQQNLTEQKTGVSISRDSENQLLQQTKDKESNYQAEIAQKKAQETQFEQELTTNGAGLQADTPGALPPSGSNPLQWPLTSTSITQYFGDTPFATKNPSVYNGHGHDGIDLRASPGTPVMAARAGVIEGTGNTDITCPGASFGKWVFIQHDDGLSTMYAHLSTILVKTGQTVTTGQLIGYSDTTGYAIGPHLHFGVYATVGSEIKSWPTTNPRPECNGKIYTMPVASLSAYLNPLSYLPPLPK